jgi:thiol-disulfide isomerase/thioredoxin
MPPPFNARGDGVPTTNPRRERMVRPRIGRRPAVAAILITAMLLGQAALGNELVLLDFWSPSCGPCMQMKPTVHGLIDANYPIREVDVTRDPQLARDFQVDRIPCFVMLANGQEVERLVGATSSERLVQMFDRARVRLQSPDVSQGPTAGASVPWTGSETAAPPGAFGGTPSSVAVEPLNRSLVNGTDTATEPIADAQAEAGIPDSEFAPSLLLATVRLHVEDAKGRAFGTGTIIDARSGEALIITCGHLFRESQGKGPVTVDLFEAGPQGLRQAAQVPGQVISYDLNRDVALLSVRPSRPVSIAPVAPPQTMIERGDRAASIGCNNGQDPTLMSTRITSRDRYQGPPNVEASGAPVEGRSGGGLFNAKGQLVGICFAADHEGNEGLYAALESIHGELDRLGLKDIYSQTAAELAAPAPAVVRGQEPLAPVMSVPENMSAGPAATVSVDPAAANAAAPKDLNGEERAAWEEIMSRAATHEVICIIRPKEPGGQSEVITLDSVSPEFARALASRARPADSGAAH